MLKMLEEFITQMKSNGELEAYELKREQDGLGGMRYYLENKEGASIKFREVESIPFIDFYEDGREYEDESDNGIEEVLKVFGLLNDFVKENTENRESGLFLMEEQIFCFPEKFKREMDATNLLEIDFVFPKKFITEEQSSIMLLTKDEYCLDMCKIFYSFLEKIEEDAREVKLRYETRYENDGLIIDVFGGTLVHRYDVQHKGNGVLKIKYGSLKDAIEEWEVKVENFFEEVNSKQKEKEESYQLEALIRNNSEVIIEKIKVEFQRLNEKFTYKMKQQIVEELREIDFEKKIGVEVSVERTYNGEINIYCLNKKIKIE